MVRWYQVVSACLLLWLLVHVEPFCSERPYGAAQPPLTRGDNASSLLPNIYHGLSYVTLARADVTRRPHPASLAQVMSVVVMARLAVCILSMAFGINSSRRRYNLYIFNSIIHSTTMGPLLLLKYGKFNKDCATAYHEGNCL